MENQSELMQHYNNICVAVDKYVGTKQEHITLQMSLEIIKKKLFDKDEKIDYSISPSV